MLTLFSLQVCNLGFSNYGWHAGHMVPYTWQDSVWVAGDDEMSLGLKVGCPFNTVFMTIYRHAVIGQEYAVISGHTDMPL